MTQQTRGPRRHERWTHLRFSVIGQLLAAPPYAKSGPMPFDRGEDRISLAAGLGRWPAVRHVAHGCGAAFGDCSILAPTIDERWPVEFDSVPSLPFASVPWTDHSHDSRAMDRD
jgi:hypothetical protein